MRSANTVMFSVGGRVDSFLLIHVFLAYAWSTVVYSMRLSTVRSANTVMFSVGGVYVLGALLLRLGRFAGGLLSTGSTYGVGSLVSVMLVLGASLHVVKYILVNAESSSRFLLNASNWGTIDADSYIKRWRLGVSRQASVSVMGR